MWHVSDLNIHKKILKPSLSYFSKHEFSTLLSTLKTCSSGATGSQIGA